MAYAPPTDFDPAVSALIRSKAAKLVGRCSFTWCDRDDLVQELALQVVKVAGKHDATKAPLLPFLNVVLQNRISTLIRSKRRRFHPEVPADEYTVDPESYEITDRRDLSLDVRGALSSLPCELGAVATHLITHTPAEVARATGRTRQQVRGLRKRIAKHFSNCGIRGNPRRPTSRRAAPVNISLEATSAARGSHD